MKLIELIYVPNLIDYARIALLWVAMQYSDWRFCVYYLISYLLDCFDGIAARALGQESKLGYWLDMLIDRVSSCIALHFAAKAVLSGTSFFPAGVASQIAVFAFYFCLVMVEVVAHGVVCYFSEVKNVHQKKMGYDHLLVRLYLDNKWILFASCAAFEFVPLSTILFASNSPPSQTVWLIAALIFAPGFIFRALANLNRLWACMFISSEEENAALRSWTFRAVALAGVGYLFGEWCGIVLTPAKH